MKNIPFNANEAKEGANVVTEHGFPVRIISYNVKSRFPIVAAVLNPDNNKETLICYDNAGISADPRCRLYMRKEHIRGYHIARPRKTCANCFHSIIPGGRIDKKLLCSKTHIVDPEGVCPAHHWKTNKNTKIK